MNPYTCDPDLAESGNGQEERAEIIIKLESPTGVGDEYKSDDGDVS